MGDNTQTIFVGDRFKNNFGTWATVIEYKGSKRIKVRFEDKYQYEGIYMGGDLRRGSFRNPYDPNIYGIGFYGVGSEITHTKGKNNPLLSVWMLMLKRCYYNDNQLSIRTYIGCTVVDEWHNFQNFAAWARQQIGFDLETRNLDKDILVKGNRVYGPDTCCFVPSRVNMLLVSATKSRGDCPVGVSFQEERNKYRVFCSDENSKTKFLGRFESADVAFLAYKTYKESVIKKVADQYKEAIDPRVYMSLINYTVDFDD